MAKIAKKRDRILAFVIDFIIYFSIGSIFMFFYGESVEDSEGIHYKLNGIPAFLLFMVGLFLWPLSEGFFGKTIGKRIVGLKVVSLENKDIDFGKSFLRFFFSFIDFLFLTGLIVASSNKSNQRIGDLIAKTFVVDTNKN